ncbi:MAG TPA: hypothetical protein VII42_08515 [Caulobacteraceae bacterium]
MRSRLRVALILGAASLAMPAMAQNYPVKDATGATQTMASKLNGGVNFPEHVLTDPTGAHGLNVTTDGAAMVDGSAVTQPVSGTVSLTGALPGFTSEPTLKLDQTGSNNGVQVENPVTVTGTFWQATQPVSLASAPLPSNAEQEAGGNAATTSTNTGATATDIGPPGATVCATDTGSCSLNALIQRTAQRLTTVNTTLGSPIQATGGTVGLVAGSAVIGHVIVDTAPTTAVTGTFWQTTQPVSIASLPSGAVTNAGAFAVQAAQSGAWNIGTITTLPAIPAGTNLIGKAGIDQTTAGTTNGVSIAQVGSTTVLSGNGTAGAGAQRVTIASDNTAFAVQAQPTPVTSGGLSTCFLVATASSNSTNCKASAGQVYHIRIFNNSTNVAYLHLINSASAPTCSSAATVDQIMVPASGGVESDVAAGEAFSTGISFCFSGGMAANDNTSVAASTYTISIGYK